jgi:hypothetical protein
VTRTLTTWPRSRHTCADGYYRQGPRTLKVAGLSLLTVTLAGLGVWAESESVGGAAGVLYASELASSTVLFGVMFASLGSNKTRVMGAGLSSGLRCSGRKGQLSPAYGRVK